MGNVVVGIHQPNFMPWLGYFYKIYQSDIFIFLDDVQIQKTGSSYTNRVSINANGKALYLTIPIKRESGSIKINETKFANHIWKKKIKGSLQNYYAKATFFKKYRDFIFDLIDYEASNLAQYNMKFIKEISKRLNLSADFKKSSEFNITTTSTQRLIDLIKAVNGDIYLSGGGGDKYQDHQMYIDNNIKLDYNNFKPFVYDQYRSSEFIPGLSIVDAIFNIGFEEILKNFEKLKKEEL